MKNSTDQTAPIDVTLILSTNILCAIVAKITIQIVHITIPTLLMDFRIIRDSKETFSCQFSKSQMETVQRPCDDQDHPTETTNIIPASDIIETSHQTDDNNKDTYVLENQEKEQKHLRSWIEFGIFVIVSMIIGVLVVCFTIRKSDGACQWNFRSTIKSSLIHSSHPQALAVGDFDNNQQIDLVVAKSGTNTIVVFLLDINATINSQQTYSTGARSRPCSLAVADFNEDGYTDIAVANNGTNNIGIFFNNRNGSFLTQQTLSTGSYRPSFITIADFNHDNHSDIAVVYHGTDNIGIHLGNGNGVFQSVTVYSTGYDSLPCSLAIGDLNDDNQLDIVVANYGTNNIGIFFGNANGSFTSQQMYSTSSNSHPTSVALADLNQDRRLDILVTHYAIGTIGMFVNEGNATFAKQIIRTLDSKSRPQVITVGNVDLDEYVDVVVVDSENDRIHVLRGYGNTSFHSLTTYDSVKNDRIHVLRGYGNTSFHSLTTYDSVSGSHPSFAVIVDIDKDNQSDLIVTNYGTNNVAILSGYSSEPAVRQTQYLIGRSSRPSSIVVSDFDKDGHLDAAVNNLNKAYVLLLNSLDNTKLTAGESYGTGNQSSPKYISLGDLNNDDRTDMIVANIGSSSVGIFFSDENGTFAPMISYPTGVGTKPWFTSIGDLNNDYYLDIVSANTVSNDITILMNDGNGNFSNNIRYSTGINSKPQSITTAYLNNDNYLDIIFSVSLKNSPIGVILGNGNGSFGVMSTYSGVCDSFSMTIVVVDINQDNCLDVIITCEDAGTVLVYRGMCDGTFQPAVSLAIGSGTSPYYVIVVDLNNDQHLDMAVTCFQTSEVVILYGDTTGNFILSRRYSTGAGSNPWALTAVDLDNDDDPEYLVTYWGTGYLAVLTEYYAAQFSKQISFSTGSAPHPYSLATADFNNDNQSDVVIANSNTDDIKVMFGLNNGLFTTPITYSIGIHSSPQYVLTSDIDKDNHVDIVTVNSKENTLSVIMNYGNGTFAEQKKYSTGSDSSPSSVAMGDLNNDQRNDLVITNQQGDNIGIFIGYDYTSFQSQITYSAGNAQGLNAVTVSDFNNDTNVDIAAVYQMNYQLGIFLGDGNGNFTLLALYPTGDNSIPRGLVVDDFNKDNSADIAVAYFGSSAIGIFIGYGNGSFSNQVTVSIGTNTGPRSLAVGDLNNDNQTDIVSINVYTNSISILIGDGTGNFTLLETYALETLADLYGPVMGDLNDDERIDIVICNYFTDTVIVFLGYGNGSFRDHTLYLVGYRFGPGSIVIGDFNNDSRLDIAVANYNINSVGILLGKGDGTLGDCTTYSTGDGTTPVNQIVGDFNNDKVLDIAVANYGTGTIVILYGYGDGTFLLGIPYSTGSGSGPAWIASGDFNKDGQLDITVANSNANIIGIFLACGREPFASITEYSIGDGLQPKSVALSDLDHDGWLDIVIANYGANNIGILMGLGGATFSPMVTYSTGVDSSPYSLAIGDFSRDNHSDIVVSNWESDNIAIFYGNGNGTFVLAAFYSTGTGSQPSTVTIGDLNGDYNLDVVVANSGTSHIFMLYGYGNGTFGDEVSYPLGYESAPYSVALTDLNQDRKIDMVVACYGTDNINALVKVCT
ncbi:unnamed protein product [Adineta ricciae]|uniref:Uncharacterized protein n=1 Tax=Adineta ricciae TaxID=249248 RepID=A0A814XEF1_ADIRI|nr:unnamed protein product [Adineta ricciae]